MSSEDVSKDGLLHDEEFALGHARHRRRSWFAIQESYLSKVITSLELAHVNPSSGFAVPVRRHLAGQQDIHAVGQLPFVADDFAGRHVHDPAKAGELLNLLDRQLMEEGELLEGSFDERGHCHRSRDAA